MEFLKRVWNDVQQGSNIDLYVTVFLAFTLVTLNVLGLASQEWIGPITLVVLGLLAIATLGTRHYIGEQWGKLVTSPQIFLRDRSQLRAFKERGQEATEIIVVGVSLFTAVGPHLDFFEQKIKDGCLLRFLLVNPESPSLQVWNSINKIPEVQEDIRQSLKILGVLMQQGADSKGKCEVRLSNAFLPFGVAAFDPQKETGLMNIEMHLYKASVGQRPHFTLIRNKDPKWFDVFREQYEQFWIDAIIWNPAAD